MAQSAFSRLMAAQVQVRQREERDKSRSSFRLDCLDGRLVPSWSLESEGGFHSHGGEPQGCMTVWGEEVTFRDVLTNMHPEPVAAPALGPAAAAESPAAPTPTPTTPSTPVPSYSYSPERSAMRVYIATSVEPAPGSPEDNGVTAGRIAPSLLKSMMQKAVRRGRSDVALRLAVALGDLSLMELLRRLPVVVLEDCSLHPELPALVWMMVAASKGYNPPAGLLYALLGVVLDLACSTQRDISQGLLESAHNILDLAGPTGPTCPTGSCGNGRSGSVVSQMSPGTSSTASPAQAVEDTRGDPCAYADTTAAAVAVASTNTNAAGLLRLHSLPAGAARTLVVSMLFRASYGGLTHDVRMLEQFAVLWASRFFCICNTTSTDPHASASASTSGGAGANTVPLADAGSNSSLPKSELLLIPTLKFTLHHSVLMELARTAPPWGLSVVMAFAPAAQNETRRALHVQACKYLPVGTVTSTSTSTATAATPPPGVSGSAAAAATDDDTTLASADHQYKLAPHPMRTLQKQYPLRGLQDLVQEGLDFHCEPALVPFVFSEIGGPGKLIDVDVEVETSNSSSSSSGNSSDDTGILPLEKRKLTESNSTAHERQEHAIGLLHDVVWYFRSCTNTRSTWDLPTAHALDRQRQLKNVSELLAKKKALARLWSLVAKPIAKYSVRRLQEVARRLGLRTVMSAAAALPPPPQQAHAQTQAQS